ncbi:MAG: hypothetical protein M0Z49_05610 [Chloroflexi bacterium]|nr:hypothetical protein [Chloroflexota bacterium]
MTSDQITSSFVQGGEGWMVLSIAAILPILWAFTLVVHFSRPYVIRFLQTLTLRFGGDVWWLSYVLMRDGLMMITLALSMIFLMPNLYIGLGLPLTAPLAAVLLFWALVIKLTRDADDDPQAFRAVSVLLVVASALYIIPQIYGLEAGGETDIWGTFGLGWLPGVLSANQGWMNPLAWPILIVSLALFGITGGYLFTRFMLSLRREGVTAGTVPGSDADRQGAAQGGNVQSSAGPVAG